MSCGKTPPSPVSAACARRVPVNLVILDNIPIIAMYLLVLDFSGLLPAELSAFRLTGFALIPPVSRLVGRRNREIKSECPWMNRGR